MEIAQPLCSQCPLENQMMMRIAPKKSYEYMVILDYPTASDFLETPKIPLLSGRHGTILLSTFRALGIDPSQVYFTSAVLCRQSSESPSIEACEACYPRLVSEILAIQPEKILVLGSIAYASLFQLPKYPSMSKIRGIGQWLTIDSEHRFYVVPTYSPLELLKKTSNSRTSHLVKYPDMVQDILKWVQWSKPRYPDLREWVEDPSKTLHPGNSLEVFVAQSEDSALDFLSLLFDQELVSIDLETTGLKPKVDTILSIGFGILQSIPAFGYSFIIRIEELRSKKVQEALLYFLLESPSQKGLHNLKFDLKFLEVFFGSSQSPRRLRIKNVTDTMLLGYALDSRTEALAPGLSLKELSRRYDIPDYHFDFEAFWALPYEERPWRRFHEYQGLDCFLTALLMKDLSMEIDEESSKLGEVVREYLVPGTEALAEIEMYGILVDQEYLATQRDLLQEEVKDILEALRYIARQIGLEIDPIEFDLQDPVNLVRLSSLTSSDKVLSAIQTFRVTDLELTSQSTQSMTPQSTLERRLVRARNILLREAEDLGIYHPGKPFNPGSSPQMVEFLGVFGIPENMTDKDSLNLAVERMEDPQSKQNARIVVSLIEQFRQKSKFISTYFQGLLDSVEEDGRVHPDYFVNGTSTGRLSCRNPNFQNLPAVVGPLVKRGIIAPPGYVIIDADYSQLELRIAAFLSRDEKMIESYREEKDLHKQVASAIFQKPESEISKFERYLAKYVDFGILYGRGALSLVDGWEMEEYVKQGGTRWTLQEAEQFLNNFLDDFPGLRDFIRSQHEFVVKNQYVESFTGRRRRFPLILPENKGNVERQSVNTPIQSLASDLTFSALTRIHNRLHPDDGHVLFTVHDSVVLEVRQEVLPQVLSLIREEMEENLPFPIDVPIVAEADLGPNWGDVQVVQW